MNAVGIDVLKGKSMMVALRPMGETALTPREYPHTEIGLERMARDILALGENTRVLMEVTGRYHEPVAAALHAYGIRVTVMNPLFIKQSGGGSIRKVKTDKADAMKIAKYALDNWVELREYIPMEAIREQLKLCSRQYNLYMKNVVALTNNLISLTDKTFPGVNELFSSPSRTDGSQKWVDFVMTFWHCECICLVSETAFTERYRKWCKRKGYHFRQQKAAELYRSSAGHITTLPKNNSAKLLITTAAKELASAKATLAIMRTEMNRLARQLPEYETVRAMYGVGETTAAQLMAEIGDVRRFPRRSSIVSYAGVDPAVNESGKHISGSNPTTKRGSPHLRKTLYQAVCTYLKHSPADEPVYQFMDKKRAEGKPYFVYMTAAQNKFLRIYYARVKECLAAADSQNTGEV
ncbi:IS110 family transposase [Butyricicoccus sp. 1XD8-22]|nr:IS110 family transposase [Butyricicoccus sp. 1XD8-22]